MIGVAQFERSPVAAAIKEFSEQFAQSQFLELSEAARKAGASSGKTQVKIPGGMLKNGSAQEQAIMAGLGWYWEPLLHDLAFLEQMRDQIALLSGAYQKFTDLAMEGFTVQCDDENAAQEVADLLINSQVDLFEAVRSSIFELCSIANCYRKPVYTRDENNGFTVKTLRPIRATAIRKLRDEDLITEGYVQLLHRPSEFVFGGTPQTPTLYTSDEMLCGIAYTDGWYAYGKPPLATLPFVVKIKLQMERDIAEMLHQHVPRIDITFTPEEQMNDDQVQAAVTQVKTDVQQLQPTDNFVHTPDTTIEYKGPQGKALDAQFPLNHVEEQFFAVLPLGPGIIGRDSNINPYTAQQQWRMTSSLINHIRKRAYQMFLPMFQRLKDERGWTALPIFGWRDLDAETSEVEQRTNEYRVQNAAASRDAGFVDQDTAAKDATAHRAKGPVKKAAAPGQLPPPKDPNKQQPPAGGGGNTPRKKVGDSKKGPKGKDRSAPTPDKRPQGKRHELFDDICASAESALGISYEDDQTHDESGEHLETSAE